METKKEEAPTALKGTYTITAYKGEEESEGKFEFVVREMDEVTFLAAQKLIQAGKETEAVRMVIKTLRISGDDPVEFGNCLKAVLSARGAVMKLVTPLEGQLKKN